MNNQYILGSMVSLHKVSRMIEELDRINNLSKNGAIFHTRDGIIHVGNPTDMSNIGYAKHLLGLD
jgi:hypothetical protein